MAIESQYTLAAVYIVKNEEKNLAVSLPSIMGITDEIIVFDSGSSDGTESLCNKFKVSYYKNEDWQGFGIQRQRAQALATSDWILMLDADEEIQYNSGLILASLSHSWSISFNQKSLL